MKKIILTLSAVALLGNTAWNAAIAGTFYVSPDGKPEADGSETGRVLTWSLGPFRTLRYMVSTKPPPMVYQRKLSGF